MLPPARESSHRYQVNTCRWPQGTRAPDFYLPVHGNTLKSSLFQLLVLFFRVFNGQQVCVDMLLTPCCTIIPCDKASPQCRGII